MKRWFKKAWCLFGGHDHYVTDEVATPFLIYKVRYCHNCDYAKIIVTHRGSIVTSIHDDGTADVIIYPARDLP